MTVESLHEATALPAVAQASPQTSIAQYFLQAIIGFGAAAIGAGALLWNSRNQRIDSRIGARREVYGRLRTLASHIAFYRANGFGELFPTLETFKRLSDLMSSENGPASLPSDEIAQQIYAMIDLARLNLKTLSEWSERDAGRKIPPDEFQDWLEQCHIQYSMAIEGTREALLGILTAIGDTNSCESLRSSELNSMSVGRLMLSVLKQREKLFEEL